RTVDVTAVNPDELCPLSKARSIARSISWRSEMSVYTTTSTSVSGDRDDAREDAGDGSGDKRLRAKQAAEEATCIARALAVSSDGPGLLLFPNVACTTSLHASWSWTPKFSCQFLNRRGY
uniref:Uncharacterized protein n=1 Tax=Oryza glaberrima TaxID=4538 RepID=I1P340_ORYGL